MTALHDTLARIWVTGDGEPSRVRWSARLVVDEDDTGAVRLALIDAKGNADVHDVVEHRGRWLATREGLEVTWVPSSQRPRGAQASWWFSDERETEETPDAEVVDFPAVDEEAPDWENFTRAELADIAKAAGHTGISRMTKAELIDLLYG